MINTKYTFKGLILDIDKLNMPVQLCTSHKIKAEIFDICLLTKRNKMKKNIDETWVNARPTVQKSLENLLTCYSTVDCSLIEKL